MNTDASTEQQSGAPGASVQIDWRVLVRFGLMVVVQCAILFISAGTVRWPMAWVYVGMTLLFTAGSRILLLRLHPDLAEERAGYAKKADAKTWDKAIMPLIAIYGPLAMLIVAGLNRRFGWPPVLPLWLQIAALTAAVLGIVFSTWALLANRFFSGVVRIQHDRGHTVVTTGPYRFVRHPGYAGGVVANLALALMLGSAWALIPAGLVVCLTIVRTALEDRTLREELPGYAEYLERTRYRLVPGVW